MDAWDDNDPAAARSSRIAARAAALGAALLCARRRAAALLPWRPPDPSPLHAPRVGASMPEAKSPRALLSARTVHTRAAALRPTLRDATALGVAYAALAPLPPLRCGVAVLLPDRRDDGAVYARDAVAYFLLPPLQAQDGEAVAATYASLVLPPIPHEGERSSRPRWRRWALPFAGERKLVTPVEPDPARRAFTTASIGLGGGGGDEEEEAFWAAVGRHEERGPADVQAWGGEALPMRAGHYGTVSTPPMCASVGKSRSRRSVVSAALSSTTAARRASATADAIFNAAPPLFGSAGPEADPRRLERLPTRAATPLSPGAASAAVAAETCAAAVRAVQARPSLAVEGVLASRTLAIALRALRSKSESASAAAAPLSISITRHTQRPRVISVAEYDDDEGSQRRRPISSCSSSMSGEGWRPGLRCALLAILQRSHRTERVVIVPSSGVCTALAVPPDAVEAARRAKAQRLKAARAIDVATLQRGDWQPCRGLGGQPPMLTAPILRATQVK